MKISLRPLTIASSLVIGALLVSFLIVFSLLPDAKKPGRVTRSPSQEEEPGVGSWLLSKLKMVPLLPRNELVAIMVENHEYARPYQEGVRDALMVLEFPVEGFISRFALVFEKDDLPERIGPVRSLRPYFIDALQPWVSTVIHAGGSPEAFAKVDKGDIVAKNLLFYYAEAERDATVPEPHNLFIRAEKAEELLTHSFPSTKWPPYRIGAPASGSSALVVSLNYYNPAHNVTYAYQRLPDAYVRSSGDVSDQGSPRNVLILETPVTGIGEHGRLTIPLTGHGRAALFHGGIMQSGVWKKKSLFEPFVFETEDGTPFLFAPGQTWITGVPSFDRLSWE